MKQSFRTVAYLSFFLLVLSSALASTLTARLKQGREEENLGEAIGKDSMPAAVEYTQSLNELMGVEACNDGDDACLRRRMVAEAHLDYIYTQNHKP